MKCIVCNICSEKNDNASHYCKKCGKNLSNIVEKTDVMFFFSSLMKWIDFFVLIFIIPMVYILENMLSLDGGEPLKLSIWLFVICLILFFISYILKKYTLKLCKKNLR